MVKLKTIIDMALGDGYLTKPSSPTAKSSLVMKHSIKQSEYALYKKGLLEEKGVKCSLNSYIDTKGYGVFQVRTTATDLIRSARDLLYPEGKKKLSNEILDMFDEKTLSLLFQDDGAREHCKWHGTKDRGRYAVKPYINAFVFHLSNFSTNENNMFVEKLSDFGIEARVKNRRGYDVVLVTKKESKIKFVSLVTPHIYQSMKYKIDTPVFYYGDL